MTTVACVWVRGNVPFAPHYVTRLASMVTRWMDRPFRFVCLTDRPYMLRGKCDTVRIETPLGMFGWWSKMRLFDDKSHLTGRVLYLDLDTLVVGGLGPILDYPAPFALVPDGGTFQGRHGLAVVKRFNSSVMVWNSGVNARLWTNWTKADTKRLWGDQDLIGEQYPTAATMPAEWFPRLSDCIDGPPKGARVILAKKPKNDEAAKAYPWFEAAWA